jgi:hypothetical protein
VDVLLGGQQAAVAHHVPHHGQVGALDDVVGAEGVPEAVDRRPVDPGGREALVDQRLNRAGLEAALVLAQE